MIEIRIEKMTDHMDTYDPWVMQEMYDWLEVNHESKFALNRVWGNRMNLQLYGPNCSQTALAFKLKFGV